MDLYLWTVWLFNALTLTFFSHINYRCGGWVVFATMVSLVSNRWRHWTPFIVKSFLFLVLVPLGFFLLFFKGSLCLLGCVRGPLRFVGVSFHAPWYPFISALPPWGLFKDDITRDSSRGHSRILWHLLGDPPDVSWDRLKNSHPWPLKTLARNSFGILHLSTGISLGVVSMSVGILSWFLDSAGFFQGGVTRDPPGSPEIVFISSGIYPGSLELW